MAQRISQKLVGGLVGLLWVSKESQRKSEPAKFLRRHQAISTREQSYGGLGPQWSKA
jgi:hypothetical protein